jgi:hypothetical protein
MIYRFKVWFEEDEDICRVIDVSPISSFEVFFNAIIDAIGFNKKLDSSFYISDDNWRKGKEISLKDSTKLLMSQAKLNTHINDPHQKFILITDFNEEWTLLIELQSIQNDVKGINYPLVFKSVGKAPKQHEGVGRFKIVDENEFDEIANKLVSKHAPLVEEGFDEEGFGEEGEDIDEEEDEFGESFGEGPEELY